MGERRIAVETLERTAAAVLGASGMPPEDAALVADTLVCADLWGHRSHGVMRLPWYVARLRAGIMRSRTRVELVVDAGAVAVLDGHDGVGQVIAAASTREAVDRARAHGVAAVSARNSNHVGCLGYFTRSAARQGCVALYASNASPAMAPWGGRDKRVGTNPWSIAAPVGDAGVMMMDIANTAVARGKIYDAQQRGVKIPADWALDEDGQPTTDPERALAGLLLPMGRHKGYAIAVMIDVLAGVLSGSQTGSDVAGPFQTERPGGNGQLFIALDVGKFLEPNAFAARMEQLIADVKEARPADGFSAIDVPGEPEERNAARARLEGVTLPERTIAELQRLLDEAEIDPTLWWE
jgi:LDH2 family malate/lactate/ureidoglycolate dehydrogenase